MISSATFRLVAKLVAFAFVLAFSGLAAAQSNTNTATAVKNDQPVNNPGLVTGLITTTGATTSNTIGSTVGSLAGGGSEFTSLGLAPGVKRFALQGQSGTGAAAAGGAKTWNGWISYSQSQVGYSFTPLQSSGTVNVGIIGADYTFSNKVIAGLAVAADKTDVALTFNGGTMTGRGVTLSPYLGVPIDKHWTLDASAGWGTTAIKTSMLGITGSNDDKRTLANVGLSYRTLAGSKWLISGRGAYMTVHDKLTAYTLSNGTAIQSGSVTLSQVRIGGQAAYNAGSLVPYAGLSYIYNTSLPNQDPVNGVSAANDKDAFQALIGLRFLSSGGLYGGIQYSSEQRTEVKNDQIMLNIGLRF